MARDPFVSEHRGGKLKLAKTAKANKPFTFDQEGGDYIAGDDGFTVRTFPMEWSFGEPGEYSFRLMTNEGAELDTVTVTVK